MKVRLVFDLDVDVVWHDSGHVMGVCKFPHFVAPRPGDEVELEGVTYVTGLSSLTYAEGGFCTETSIKRK